MCHIQHSKERLTLHVVWQGVVALAAKEARDPLRVQPPCRGPPTHPSADCVKGQLAALATQSRSQEVWVNFDFKIGEMRFSKNCIGGSNTRAARKAMLMSGWGRIGFQWEGARTPKLGIGQATCLRKSLPTLEAAKTAPKAAFEGELDGNP